VVEQASANSKLPVVGPANCFATRYGRSQIRIQSQTMQLGLRFATAKLAGLRTSRGGEEPRGAKLGLGGQRSQS